MTRIVEIIAAHIVGPFIPPGNVTMGNPATYYQTAEAKAGRVATKYRAYRRRGVGAARAFHLAMSRPAIYERGFADGDAGASLGAPWESGSTILRWCENPAALGLRFVGYSDEVASHGINHTGWFNRDGCQHSRLRGAVYRLPHGRLVPGYVEFEGRGPMNGDSAALAFGETLREEKGGTWSDNSGVWEAAKRADGIAESVAEDERENDESYQAGARAAERMAEAEEARREALALLADMRAKGRKAEAEPGPVCRALRSALEGLLETISEAREKRLSAWMDCPGYLDRAWLDGYSDGGGDWKAFARSINRLDLLTA